MFGCAAREGDAVKEYCSNRHSVALAAEASPSQRPHVTWSRVTPSWYTTSAFWIILLLVYCDDMQEQ